LGQAIAALPPQRRDVILLSYFMGQNDPQIGTLLHLEPQTIRYRRQTALQRLKEILENLDYEK
jgi:DNA-directed RNA polymerase specialized sigma24 family protein